MSGGGQMTDNWYDNKDIYEMLQQITIEYTNQQEREQILEEHQL